MSQLMASSPSEDDITELYEDLKYVFDSPFDTLINEAVIERGAVYIEHPNQSVN
jgi:hypothetical protein